MSDTNGCPATNNRGEPCKHDAGWGTPNDTGPCKFHGGASSGAPEGNQNALKHGLNADPMGLFDWLQDNEPEAAAYIVNKLHEYADRAPQPVFALDVTDDDIDSVEDATAHLTAYGDDLLSMCVRDYARKRAEYLQITEGLLTTQTRSGETGAFEVTDSNPINIDLDRFDRQQLKRKDKLGLLPDDGADVEVEVTAKMWDDLTDYYED
jgi:hypothetical protein